MARWEYGQTPVAGEGKRPARCSGSPTTESSPGTQLFPLLLPLCHSGAGRGAWYCTTWPWRGLFLLLPHHCRWGGMFCSLLPSLAQPRHGEWLSLRGSHCGEPCSALAEAATWQSQARPWGGILPSGCSSVTGNLSPVSDSSLPQCAWVAAGWAVLAQRHSWAWSPAPTHFGGSLWTYGPSRHLQASLGSLLLSQLPPMCAGLLSLTGLSVPATELQPLGRAPLLWPGLALPCGCLGWS